MADDMNKPGTYEDISDLKEEMSELMGDFNSADTDPMARIEGIRAGLTKLTEIIVEQDEVINRYMKYRMWLVQKDMADLRCDMHKVTTSLAKFVKVIEDQKEDK